MKRLRSSARYFGFDCDNALVRRKLAGFINGLKRKQHPMRIRLLLDREGCISIEASPLDDLPKEPRANLGGIRTNSRDKYLFHKTTRRELYESEFAASRTKGYVDTIFQNEKGEITEGTRTNVVIRSGEMYYTPLLDSGLLPGTFRAHLLSSNRIHLVEKTLYPDDLAAADEVFLCNAVRGMIRVRIPELSS
jgi:para-aminobenzoate synthetase/4-amino-4-deoxychorismate lyase